MRDSLIFAEKIAVYYILERYVQGSSIQSVVFQPLSYSKRYICHG